MSFARLLRVAIPLLLAVAMTSEPVSSQSSRDDAAPPPAIRWEPYETMGADDQPLVGQLGRITVPERRDGSTDATIELAFVRWPSENPDPGPPIVILAGGPGGSGIEGSVGPATGRMIRLLQYADVIGLEQRGTGLSSPDLSECPVDGGSLPDDVPVTAEALVAAHVDAVARVRDWWTEQGVDLGAYNTEESADDVDDLRRALGVERISLWGSSYGTHLGLAYLRRHGEHVHRAVFSKVEGPDHTLKLPSTTQRFLEQLGELVAADPNWAEAMPDLPGAVATLLEQLADKPVELTTDDGRTLTVGPLALQYELAGTLGYAMRMVAVPAMLQRMQRGDFSELLPSALDLRHVRVGSAMAQWMDCASGASRTRLRAIAEQARDRRNLLGNASNLPWLADCSTCGDVDLGDGFRARLASDVPVLFVSGALDARTPPENVEELLRDMPAAVHIVVDNVGHEALENMSPEYRELLAAYLRGEPVQSARLDMPPLPFRPGDGG